MGEALTVPLEEAFMSRTEEGEVRVGRREGGREWAAMLCGEI